MAQDMEALQAESERRGDEFEPDEEEGSDWENGINPGREAENNRKKFYGELRKVIAEADILIEVLDARDPGSCRSDDLEREVASAGNRLVLLLNKIDLVPKHAVEAWMKYLQRSFPTIAFKAARAGTVRATHAATSAMQAPEGLLRSSHGVVGADELMQLLKNYARSGGGQKTKHHIYVGVVGYPNTGKSSVINSMKRHVAVPVGGTPGVTKAMQLVQLDQKVTLIDSPGVVFAGASDDPSVALRNVVKVEHINDPIGVVEALVAKTPREALHSFYGIEHDINAPGDFLVHVAKTRGKLVRGKGLDIPAAARSVLTDWTTGKFRYFVLPPKGSEAVMQAAVAESTQVVSSLAPKFDIDALLRGQGAAPVVLGRPQQMCGGGGGDVSMEGDDEECQQVEVDM
eukprot:gnl/TRDRNA2_/TRDRNA2_129705_c0_seq1.p1 gnl/TRDRNA2_/TRDRNA2_129705_c0~~gnl/TRDRNA2_/TRDRNA2_129705_c0_seq1.p1  ORF type:complete len:455 (+),score=123.27 gnl/TRDRNA2_/TRDRNA2_129705_c0_seq1:165-1367(+)